MQTLISAFDDRAAAQRAIEKLVKAGFAREDVHLQEAPAAPSADDAQAKMVGERTMDSAEREVAVDRDALTAVGHFFVSLFGLDHHARHAGTYKEAVRRGHSVVVVDALDDAQAEHAATLLHDLGAIDVDERVQEWRASGWADEAAPPAGAPGLGAPRPGVRVLERGAQPPLREIVGLNQAGPGYETMAPRENA